MPLNQAQPRQQIINAFNRVPGRCACVYELANEVSISGISNTEKLEQIYELLETMHRERELELVITNEDKFFTLYSAPWTLWPF